MKANCDRCESRGQFHIPAVVGLDGAYFCRPCADFYKEDVQRKAADACKNANFHWHQVDGYCATCHQTWSSVKANVDFGCGCGSGKPLDKCCGYARTVSR